ncbi:hypothetical protein T01_3387 [Trichinella spiralis]|uniref:Uncharacterized protein n=1 Tax=Trichinella spiralis TaxID=6334 RepID=A0A0V1BJ86_TRISP|nr:hypothetical protein T01_3387 [Trichinella spiralis]
MKSNQFFDVGPRIFSRTSLFNVAVLPGGAGWFLATTEMPCNIIIRQSTSPLIAAFQSNHIGHNTSFSSHAENYQAQEGPDTTHNRLRDVRVSSIPYCVGYAGSAVSEQIQTETDAIQLLMIYNRRMKRLDSSVFIKHVH